jgi:hypothetical protein
MAIVHKFGDVRQYYTKWIVTCDIINNVTEIVYPCLWQFPSEVTEQSQVVQDQITKAKTEIQFDVLCNENKMNENEVFGIALDHLREMEQAIIKRIRAVPTVSQATALTWLNASFPNSIINFANLYLQYKRILGFTTWDEFKTWVVIHKFREID